MDGPVYQLPDEVVDAHEQPLKVGDTVIYGAPDETDESIAAHTATILSIEDDIDDRNEAWVRPVKVLKLRFGVPDNVVFYAAGQRMTTHYTSFRDETVSAHVYDDNFMADDLSLVKKEG